MSTKNRTQKNKTWTATKGRIRVPVHPVSSPQYPVTHTSHPDPTAQKILWLLGPHTLPCCPTPFSLHAQPCPLSAQGPVNGERQEGEWPGEISLAPVHSGTPTSLLPTPPLGLHPHLWGWEAAELGWGHRKGESDSRKLYPAFIT